MRFGSFQFSPKLWAIVLYLLVFVCMLWLGNWQLGRAALKVSLREAAVIATNEPATPIEAIPDLEKAASAYQRVAITGHYDPARQFLWDNRTHKGVAGLEVIVPFKTSMGQWVLINRGWLPMGLSRQAMPDPTFLSDQADGALMIEGFLSRPSKGFSSGAALDDSGAWPRLLQYFDYQQMGAALGEPVLPVVVQGQSVDIDGVTVTVPTARAEWLVANWQPAASGPAKHYSYAFQWFAMALALTVLFLLVNTRKLPPSNSSPDDDAGVVSK